MLTLRKACVAGQFYPESPTLLEIELEGYLKISGAIEETVVAMISPHAAYTYSGRVAGEVFARAKIPDTVILIGPNHKGEGAGMSIISNGEWETPLGNVAVNEELTALITESSGMFTEDASAHAMEHSLEVQLPFMYSKNPSVSIAPIVFKHTDFAACERAGEAIAAAIGKYGRETLIVVSSDMNHYEPEDITKEKDKLAIDMILALDAKGLLDVTCGKDISMCGVVPTAVALVAAAKLGATNGKLVNYDTSGKVSGDHERVVGYAGIVIK